MESVDVLVANAAVSRKNTNRYSLYSLFFSACFVAFFQYAVLRRFSAMNGNCNEQEMPLATIEEFGADGRQPVTTTYLFTNDTTCKHLTSKIDLVHGAEKGKTLEQISSDVNCRLLSTNGNKEIKDRFNLVFLILILHGIGILMPWNMFTTAESYFLDFKLNSSDTVVEDYRQHFLSYLGIASHVPNVVCNALNLFIQLGGGQLTFRIVGSISIEIIIFIVTIVLAMLDSSAWCGAFFYMTMASVVVINMANGVYQNCVYGLAAKLPMKYSMAVVFGSNLSGVFSSLILIISLAVSPNIRTAAIYYFMTALFVLLMCIDTYFALPLLHFYQYHQKRSASVSANPSSSRPPPYWEIFKKAWPQCFNVFFVFFVTLTIFPAVHADIKRVDPTFFISEKYFTPITCYLCFNLLAMIGSLLPKWFTKPGPRFLWIPVILRSLMIPYFMLCNYKPDKRMIPVLINSDWAYLAMAACLGVTSGYLSSLAMMYAPRCVKAEHAPAAAMMATLFLVLGVVSGVHFTFFVSWLVKIKLFSV